MHSGLKILLPSHTLSMDILYLWRYEVNESSAIPASASARSHTPVWSFVHHCLWRVRGRSLISESISDSSNPWIFPQHSITPLNSSIQPSHQACQSLCRSPIRSNMKWNTQSATAVTQHRLAWRYLANAVASHGKLKLSGHIDSS